VVKKGYDPRTVASERSAKTRHVYRTAINGFSAKLSDSQVARLARPVTRRRRDRELDQLERDGERDLGQRVRDAEPPAVHEHPVDPARSAAGSG
jgi:Peptidase inhibitor I9